MVRVKSQGRDRWCRWRRVVLSLLAAWSLGACSRVNPAYLGDDLPGLVGDGGSTRDGGLPDGVTPPSGDGGTGDCIPGEPCLLPDKPCTIGTTTCDGDAPGCLEAFVVPDGTLCAVDKVCKDGSCIPCASGAQCPDPEDDCQVGTLDCSSGTPVCASFVAAPNGTPCVGGLCYTGVCRSDLCGGLDGTLCDPGKVCDQVGCAPDLQGVCVPRPQGCPEVYAPVCGCDGVTYGNDCERLIAGVALARDGPCLAARELCMNGVDDNGDGLADCEDPQCDTGYVCAPAIPAGWSGVGWVATSTTPECSAELTAVDLYSLSDLAASPAACECQCGTPVSWCSAALTCYDDNVGCSGVSVYSTLVDAECTPITSAPEGRGCTVSAPEAHVSCPTTLKVTKPTVAWLAGGRACLTTTGGHCAVATNTCIPRPPLGTEGPCIGRAGEFACPSPYTVKIIFFTGQYLDSRSCTACGDCIGSGTCSCETPGECGVEFFNDNMCTTSATVLAPADDSTCTSVPSSGGGGGGVALVGTTGVTGTECFPPNSSPTGEVAPAGKITVCCHP